MDDRRFDDLTRQIAVSRRSAIRSVLGVIGGSIGALGTRRATAADVTEKSDTLVSDLTLNPGDQDNPSPDQDDPAPDPSACPPWRQCGDFCCPAEYTGCSVTSGRGGLVIDGCICPEDFEWEAESNVCSCTPKALSCKALDLDATCNHNRDCACFGLLSGGSACVDFQTDAPVQCDADNSCPEGLVCAYYKTTCGEDDGYRCLPPCPSRGDTSERN